MCQNDLTNGVWHDILYIGKFFINIVYYTTIRKEDVTISVLFVQTDGCYANTDGIDPWDESRDARKYRGNNPVIAHPPCQLWGSLAYVNYARWGGEHNKPGNDKGCFDSALQSVNRCGGVLEHPANSRAWKKYKLDKPSGVGWKKSGKGWVCEVWQSAYGHRANKATWLYYIGIKKPFDLCWDKVKGSHQVGWYDKRGKSKNKPTLSKKEANATPLKFMKELINLCMYSKHTTIQ